MHLSPCSCSLKKKNQSSALPEIALRRRKSPSAVSNSMHFIPRGVVIVQFASSPPLFSSKGLVVRSTRNCALSWKVLGGAATFGAGLDFCLIAEFSSGQFGLFPFLPLATARQIWNIRELHRIIACRIGPLHQRGHPEALACWPCATQLAFPRLCAQFQSGFLIDWLFALVLNLGELSRVGLRVFYQ